VTRPSLPAQTRLFYGLGAVAYGVKDNGFSYFLLLYYNQVLGLPEAWVGLGIMLALFLDAVSDPVVGHLSDHFRSRWGRRHPFMYAAALPVAVAYYLLWRPPAGLSPEQLFAYFVVVAVLVRTLITFYEIPSTSLVAELTPEYDERTSVLGWRFFFGWWGGLGMAVLAYAVLLRPDAAHPVGQLNPAGYRDYGLAAALIMASSILVSAAGTHSYIPYLKQPPTYRPRGLRENLRQLRETLANRSLLVLLCAGVFAAMAVGLTAALNIYFNTYFWELTANQISLLVVANFVSAAAAFALAPSVSRRLGKKRAAIAVSLTGLGLGPAPVVLRLLGAFPPNGSPGLLPILAVINATVVTLVITSSILIASMVADVVEDSEVVTGRRSEGVFFAANSFVQKAVSGVGIFVSTLLLRAIGFPGGAQPGAVDPEVVRRLGLVYVPVLVALYLVAIGFLSAYRISRASHEANLARLANRVNVPGQRSPG
jgi:Na+/melibiose symporter-like transporter